MEKILGTERLAGERKHEEIDGLEHDGYQGVPWSMGVTALTCFGASHGGTLRMEGLGESSKLWTLAGVYLLLVDPGAHNRVNKPV